MSIGHKVMNKLAGVIAKFVPYNTKYKPECTTTLADLRKKEGAKYHEIHPPYISELKLTPKFIEDCSSYNKPMLSVPYPGDFLISISNGRVYNVDTGNIAIISSDNHLVEELSFQWRSGEKLAPGRENIIFQKKMFTTPRRFTGTVCSLLSGGGAVDYYYHWVIDSIPKLYLLKQSGLFDHVDYFLVPNYKHKFQIEYLKFLGIDEDRIINAEIERHIQADSLIVASYIRIMAHLPQWVPDFLHGTFAAWNQNKKDKLIYIARGDAAVNRKVMNENELIGVLKDMDFEIHYLSRLTVCEQAQLFNSAKLIVASHGGGLTNLVFCDPGTKVIEFFPDNYVNHLFYDIANKRDLVYDYIVCKAENFTGNDLERALANVVADIPVIKTKIAAMLQR